MVTFCNSMCVVDGKAILLVVAGALTVFGATNGTSAADAMHKCDPPPEQGWSVVPERQVLSETDGAPFAAGPAGDWFVERTTTVLPFCHYYNSIGIYSLNSYSLSPVTTGERVAICRAAAGSSVAVAPYAGPCPPK
jgi:hypothetical protein